MENKVKNYFNSLPERNKESLKKIYREEEKNIVFGTYRETEIQLEIKKIIEEVTK